MPFSGSLSAVLWEREAGVSPVFLSLEAAGKEKKVHLRLENGRCSTHPCCPSSSLGPRWLPESSRWLLLHGRSQLAVENLRKVAVMNGRTQEGERLTKEVGSRAGRKGRDRF